MRQKSNREEKCNGSSNGAEICHNDAFTDLKFTSPTRQNGYPTPAARLGRLFAGVVYAFKASRVRLMRLLSLSPVPRRLKTLDARNWLRHSGETR